MIESHCRACQRDSDIGSENRCSEVCKTQNVHLRIVVKMLRADIVKSLLWSVEDIQWKSNNNTQ